MMMVVVVVWLQISSSTIGTDIDNHIAYGGGGICIVGKKHCFVVFPALLAFSYFFFFKFSFFNLYIFYLDKSYLKNILKTI